MTLSFDFWTLDFQGQILKKPYPLSWDEMDKLIRSQTQFVTLNFDLIRDLDLGLSRSDIKKAVSQKWEG